MDNMVKELKEMCETLARSLKEANEKLRNAGGKVSSTDMEYINRLTHSLKSIKATIAMIEAEEDEGGYSERYSRDSYRRGYARDDGYSRDYRDDYARDSYARGRNARRDSMGRYSSDGYSNGGDMADDLRNLMHDIPDEATRQKMQRLIQQMEQR